LLSGESTGGATTREVVAVGVGVGEETGTAGAGTGGETVDGTAAGTLETSVPATPDVVSSGLWLHQIPIEARVTAIRATKTHGQIDRFRIGLGGGLGSGGPGSRGASRIPRSRRAVSAALRGRSAGFLASREVTR
jgi:hypothetical protein